MRTRYVRLLILSQPAILLGCADADYDQVYEKTFPDIGLSIQIEAAPPAPVWFSPQPVRVFVRSARSRKLVIEDRLANDGARLGPENFAITFESDSVLLCFKGQEQAGVLHSLALSGLISTRLDEEC